MADLSFRSLRSFLDLKRNTLLRELLLHVRDRPIEARSADEAVTALIPEFARRLPQADPKEAAAILSVAVRDGLITHQDGRISLSARTREELDKLDIIFSSCGASMVRVQFGLPIYCWHCGGLM